MITRCAALFAIALCVLATVPAFADAAVPADEQQIEEKLKTFDPTAVTAARHYYTSPKVRGGMLSMLSSMTPAIIASEEKQKHGALSDADKAQIGGAIDRAMAANFDYLIGLNMIAALELLSKDQLVALDNFYSSPMGQSILESMPKIGKRLPGMMSAFMPKFINSVQAEMKATQHDNL